MTGRTHRTPVLTRRRPCVIAVRNFRTPHPDYTARKYRHRRAAPDPVATGVAGYKIRHIHRGGSACAATNTSAFQNAESDPDGRRVRPSTTRAQHIRATIGCEGFSGNLLQLNESPDRRTCCPKPLCVSDRGPTSDTGRKSVSRLNPSTASTARMTGPPALPSRWQTERGVLIAIAIRQFECEHLRRRRAWPTDPANQTKMTSRQH